MGIKDIENHISNNRSSYEEELPEGHLERFGMKLNEKAGTRRNISNRSTVRFISLNTSQVAVISFILISAILSAIIYFKYPTDGPEDTDLKLTSEIHNAKMYYNQLTNEGITRIEECIPDSTTRTEIIDKTRQRIRELDNKLTNLESKLIVSPENQRLKNAYMISLKTKTDFIDQVYMQICNNLNQ